MKNISILSLLAIILVSSSCNSNNDIKQTKEGFVMSTKMLSTSSFVDVKQEQLKNELSFFGKITADNKKLIEVYPVVGGNVAKVYVELGDYVKKGQLLATIRSIEVAGYEKELEDAKNDVIVKKNNYKVAQELFEGKLNADRDVVESKSEYEKALSQLNRIQETYKIYNMNKGAIYEVRAPMSGFIIEKKINEDMLLRNDRTDNIFDIAEINEVWAVANINETDINKVTVGIDAAVTTLSYPDKTFIGKLDKIFNVIDPETKAMKAVVKLNNTDFILKPEMSATIKLSYNEDKKMLVVPSSAIIFDKSKNYVMIFKDRSHIETRQIEVYRQVGDVTYISAGLTIGEKIMTQNQLLVYDALND